MPVVGPPLPPSPSQPLALRDLIEEALSILYRVTERPQQVTVGSNDLTSSSSDTTFTVGDATLVNPPVPVEFGQELVLVTAKNEDTGVLTCSRGYANTPVSAQIAGSIGLVNPQWPRRDVRRAILRCFQGPMTTYVPYLTSAVYTTATGKYFIELPSNVINVTRVAFTKTRASGLVVPASRWQEVSQWDFVQDVPSTVAASGKIVTFSPAFSSYVTGGSPQEFHITHQVPYAWSGGTSDPTESETIAVPLGAEDLPALYASARLVAGRELTRLEVDKVEEWSQEASIRQGINMRAVQQLWQEFYRRVDEVHRIKPVPKHRPFRKMSRR